MTGWVRRVHLVQRHHQSLAEEPVPDPVDDRPGEELAIAGVERQLDQLGPGAELGRGGGTFSFLARSSAAFSFFCSSLDGSLASGVIDPPAGQEHHPGLLFDVFGCLEADDAVAVLAQKARVLVAVDECAGEERLHSVEVVLLPVLDERVIMALGATDVDAEEGRADVGGEPIEVLDPLP